MKGQAKLTGLGYFGLLLMFIGAAIGSGIWMFYQINKAELSTALWWGGIFAIPGMVIVVLNDGRNRREESKELPVTNSQATDTQEK
ncbi:hypothetical protein M1D58_27400 (plasmid) [Pseudomonas sp. R4-76]|uniref:hypothetical protein n=1 Tax=unclassified Pseudomonas TaxID=196821 RepID=UPI003DA933C5